MIVKLWLGNFSIQCIAGKMGVSCAHVVRELREKEKEWRDERLNPFKSGTGFRQNADKIR